MTPLPLNLLFDKLNRLIFLKSHTGGLWLSLEDISSQNFSDVRIQLVINSHTHTKKNTTTATLASVFRTSHKNTNIAGGQTSRASSQTELSYDAKISKFSKRTKQNSIFKARLISRFQ